MNILIHGSNSITDAIMNRLDNKFVVYHITSNIINKSYDDLTKYMKQIGTIHALINNCAYNILAPLEDLDIKDIRKVFNINLFNSVKIIKSILPIMREQNFGKIINIVSVAGRVGFPMASIYSGSQFALEGLSESIRYELKKCNIKIVLVEVGVVKGHLYSITKRSNHEYYTNMLNNMDKGLRYLLEHGIDADDVAKLITKILQDDEPEFRYSVGNDASMLLEAKSKLSDKEFEQFMEEEILSY